MGGGAGSFTGGTLTSALTLRAGSSSAGTAPIYFQAGTVLSAPAAHALEWDGTNLFVTQATGPTRKTLAFTDSNITGNAAAHSIAGALHTASGLSVGQVIRATGATTFAWQQLQFSDLGGSASDSQVDDTITASNYCALAGGAACAMTGDLRYKSLGLKSFRVEAYADLQAAIDACNTAGAGDVELQPNTTYSVPSGGLILKDKCIVRGHGWKGQGAVNSGRSRIDCANSTVSPCIGQGTISNFAGITDVEILVKDTGANNGWLIDGGNGWIVERVIFSCPSCGTGTRWPIEIRNLASAGHIFNDIRVMNGASSSAGAECRINQTTDIVLYKLTCGTGSGHGLSVETSNDVVLIEPFIDENGGGHSVTLVASPRITIRGGQIFSANSSTSRAIKADATSDDLQVIGARIRPFSANVTTTLVESSADRGSFTAMRMREGSFTNSFLFNSGSDNNFVQGYVGGTISDSGSNNRSQIFDGSNWAGNLRVSIFDAGTGFRIAGAATSGRYLKGDGTNFVQSSGSASGTGTCTNQFARALNSDAAPTCATVSLTADVTGVLPVANWSPLTTNGDLAYHNGSTTTRLARGTNGQCLTSSSTTIVWGGCGTVTSIDDIGDVTITTPVTNDVLCYNGSIWVNCALSTSFADNTFLITDDGDATKKLAFQVSGVSTGTTRTVTIPNSNTTLPIISQVVTISGPTAARTFTFPDADATMVGRATTDTLTNKTLDAEATGNVLSLPVKLWFPMAACQDATATLIWDTPTSNPAVAACITGTNTQKGVAEFADGANSLSVQYTALLPDDWTSTGGVDVKFKWLTSATTGSVVWQIATSCVADAETDDPSFNTANTVTDAAKGTANQTNDATITGITMTGCAAGELLHIKVLRDPAHASDNLAATARLIGVELTWRRAI